MLRASVYVTLRPGILDPQGETIRASLQRLGHAEVEAVRVGKYLELDLRTEDRNAAEQSVTRMCDALLANPVIEDYAIEIMDGESTCSLE